MSKAVCFDLDGVYFTPESFQRFKRSMTGVGGDESFLYASEEMKRFKSGVIEESEYWELASKKLNMPIGSIEEVVQKFEAAYEVQPEVAQCVNKVRELGLMTCVCSNNFVTRINALDRKFGFLKQFDHVVLSYEEGVTKPDRAIFEILARRVGVVPEEIVYSDDSEEKLAGAKEIGIDAFVYQNFDQFKRELKIRGIDL